MTMLDNNINICFLAIYPELFLLFSIILIISFLVILDNLYKHRLNLIKISAVLYAYTLFFVFFLNLLLLKTEFFIFYNSFIINQFIIHIKLILTLLLLMIIFISLRYFKFENIYTYEFFILLNLITLGLFILISANDLLVMYMGLEIISLSFYILTTLKIHSNFSTEAGMKYFILGAFSSGLLLYGSSIIYGTVGSINFTDIASIVNMKFIEPISDTSDYYNIISFNTFIVGIIFIIVGLLFKLGAAPFHMWLPDVYEGAPTIVTLIFSTIPKIVIFGFLVNMNLHFLLLKSYIFNDMFFYVAILSIMIGSLGALYQNKIKRLLAYSAINHVGYLLIGFLTFTSFSIASLFFYLFIYIIISINLFILLIILRKYTNNLKIKKISEYAIIFKSYPILAINFSILLFSIAGIPPLVGFYSKFYIFVSALETKLYLLVIIAAIFSVISSLYYIRIIKLIFFKKFEYWTLFYNINFIESILCSFILFFNILFFCYPEFIILYISNLLYGL